MNGPAEGRCGIGPSPRFEGIDTSVRDLSQVTADLSQSLRLTGVALIPVGAALVVLGPHLTILLFAHGNAALSAAHLTGVVLAAYGLALVPFAGYQIMLRVYYALGDTRTPALISVAVSAALLVTSLVAARLYRGTDMVIALAGCMAIAYALGFVIVAQLLRRRIAMAIACSVPTRACWWPRSSPGSPLRWSLRVSVRLLVRDRPVRSPLSAPRQPSAPVFIH
uniref:lipid II flippase MurJ n=1 Tax=Nonomuraea sp. CA-252377 TaxID=3240003 RepID=UPI003F494F75